jgi:hypothetical protein
MEVPSTMKYIVDESGREGRTLSTSMLQIGVELTGIPMT